MNDMLTVAEAVKLSGKSRSTIRRFYEAIAKDDKHADRKHILPNPKQRRERRANNEPYQWKIARALIEREFGKKNEQDSQSGEGESRKAATVEIESVKRENELLRDQVNVKDNQIKTANNTIDQLNERLREGNILLNKFTGESIRQLPEGQKPKWWQVRFNKLFS